MVSWRKNPMFDRLLAGVQAEKWSGLLLSAGGNDLIDALQVFPFFSNGKTVPRHQRLLLTEEEWGSGTDPGRYLSDEGWTTFKDHMSLQYRALIERRDSNRSPNKLIPTFFHVYDYPTPRNAPAGMFPKQTGPWLYPAVQAYRIPPEDWIPLARRLIDRLAEFVAAILQQLPSCHLVDTRGCLIPADMGSIGPNHDWQNEIHPTRTGYRKVADMYAQKITAVLSLDRVPRQDVPVAGWDDVLPAVLDGQQSRLHAAPVPNATVRHS
jgi:lysophospholipase L1-like esterase